LHSVSVSLFLPIVSVARFAALLRRANVNRQRSSSPLPRLVMRASNAPIPDVAGGIGARRACTIVAEFAEMLDAAKARPIAAMTTARFTSGRSIVAICRTWLVAKVDNPCYEIDDRREEVDDRVVWFVVAQDVKHVTVRACGVLIAALLLLLVAPGVAAAGSANPASVNFGDVALNTTASQPVAITVDAGYEIIAATGSSALNPPYHFAFGTCTGPFVGPGTCSVTESFTPTSVGPASADLSLTECPTGVGSCINIPVHFDGKGVTPLTISTTSLPNGTIGTPYPTTTLQANGGVTPYQWAVTGGTKPDGLSLDPSTGILSGTPTASGPFTFTVTVTDSGSPTPQRVSQTYTVTINGTADLAVSIAAAPTPAQTKKPLTLTITVANLGPNTTAASLSNVLPSASEFVSATASQGSCATPPVGSTGTMTCSLGTLASGASVTVTVTITPTGKKAMITDTATVAVGAFTIDPVSANNTATVTVQTK
jgi:uncharacterized repeat protein (TIGR01451 family)